MARAAEARPRERLVGAAADLIRRQGVAATGMRQIVSRANAPRGSLQHYFPGGKDQLVVEAIRQSAAFVVGAVDGWLDAHPDATPGEVLTAMTGWWRDLYLARGFADGCPFAATAADLTATSDTVHEAVRQAFDSWQRAVERGLARAGVPRHRVAPVALVVMSAIEGAILLARAHQDIAPLVAVIDELAPALDVSATTAQPDPAPRRH